MKPINNKLMQKIIFSSINLSKNGNKKDLIIKYV